MNNDSSSGRAFRKCTEAPNKANSSSAFVKATSAALKTFFPSQKLLHCTSVYTCKYGCGFPGTETVNENLTNGRNLNQCFRY